jgi:hypothetical protein
LGQALASAVAEQRITEHVRRKHLENFAQSIALNLQIFGKPNEEYDYRGD